MPVVKIKLTSPTGETAERKVFVREDYALLIDILDGKFHGKEFFSPSSIQLKSTSIQYKSTPSYLAYPEFAKFAGTHIKILVRPKKFAVFTDGKFSEDLEFSEKATSNGIIIQILD